MRKLALRLTVALAAAAEVGIDSLTVDTEWNNRVGTKDGRKPDMQGSPTHPFRMA